ncbi:MAG: hypothetical protein M0R21_11590 [Lentimicrobiaceae bacterium]|nr:hypothetical protein [Lentimicrobiaceae bacterium]
MEKFLKNNEPQPANDDLNPENLPKANPFQLPSAYFDALSQRISARCWDEKNKLSLSERVKIYLFKPQFAFLFIILLICTVVGFYLFHANNVKNINNNQEKYLAENTNYKTVIFDTTDTVHQPVSSHNTLNSDLKKSLKEKFTIEKLNQSLDELKISENELIEYLGEEDLENDILLYN